MMHLTKKDFRLDWFNNGTKGGQHANKHDNCCRITHIETGLRSQATESRSRKVNQERAFRHLVAKLLSYYEEPTERRVDRERIRTYHAPRNEVLDHASGLKMTYTEVVGKPNLGPMIEARRINMR